MSVKTRFDRSTKSVPFTEILGIENDAGLTCVFLSLFFSPLFGFCLGKGVKAKVSDDSNN